MKHKVLIIFVFYHIPLGNGSEREKRAEKLDHQYFLKVTHYII